MVYIVYKVVVMSRRGPKPSQNSISRQGFRRTFYVAETVSAQLDKFCREKNMNVSTVVNRAIENHIADAKSNVKSSFSVISLFSGCGGMDLGFKGGFDFLGRKYKEHKFNIVFANDIFKHACDSYSEFFGHDAINADIKELLDSIDTMPLDEKWKHFPQNVDVVVGGFPCQDFSVAGKRKGLDAERGQLYQQMKRVIGLSNPKIFVAENVKGLTNMGDVLEIIKNDFANAGLHGYKIFNDLLHAANYGVPQTRERVFIVGIRNDLDASAFLFHTRPIPQTEIQICQIG